MLVILLLVSVRWLLRVSVSYLKFVYKLEMACWSLWRLVEVCYCWFCSFCWRRESSWLVCSSILSSSWVVLLILFLGSILTVRVVLLVFVGVVLFFLGSCFVDYLLVCWCVRFWSTVFLWNWTAWDLRIFLRWGCVFLLLFYFCCRPGWFMFIYGTASSCLIFFRGPTYYSLYRHSLRVLFFELMEVDL